MEDILESIVLLMREGKFDDAKQRLTEYGDERVREALRLRSGADRNMNDFICLHHNDKELKGYFEQRMESCPICLIRKLDESRDRWLREANLADDFRDRNEILERRCEELEGKICDHSV